MFLIILKQFGVLFLLYYSTIGNTSTLCVLNLGPFPLCLLAPYLGGAGSTSTDVTRAKHLLISENSPACVLLVVQELLESAEASLVLLDQVPASFLHQPTHLILVLLHLKVMYMF